MDICSLYRGVGRVLMETLRRAKVRGDDGTAVSN
jgi:hypothetical protein